MRFSSPSLRLSEGCVGEALHIGGRSGETSPFDFVLYDADPRVDLEEIAQTSAQSSSAAPRFAESRVGVFAGEALHINAPIGETLGVIAVWLRCSGRTLLAVPDHGTGCRRTCRSGGNRVLDWGDCAGTAGGRWRRGAGRGPWARR